MRFGGPATVRGASIFALALLIACARAIMSEEAAIVPLTDAGDHLLLGANAGANNNPEENSASDVPRE